MSDIQTFTVQRDDKPNIKFKGEELASSTSKEQDSDRWADLTLYQTTGGKYVCKLVRYSKWVGERTRHEGAVCATAEKVIEFFGHSDTAKALYYEADIAAELEVA